jgi:hypothetical protein
MQRPSGITVLAILYFVSGGLSLATSCFAMVVGNWLAVTAERPGAFPMLLAPASAFRGQLAFWLGLIGTAAALFKLVAAVGLWTMQPWGWRLALFSGTLKLVTHVVAANRRAITPAGVVGALVNGAILVYLTIPHVQRALWKKPDDARPDDEAVAA